MNQPSIDLIALGEALVDLTQVDVTPAGVALYERNPGGAPANLAAAAAKLGLNALFVGAVGDDPQGRFVADTLRSCGVNTSAMVFTREAYTTLAFATFDEDREGYTYSFVRHPGADELLKPSDLPNATIEHARILHVGTLSLTNDPCRSTVLDAVQRASQLHTLVSCDVNYRAHAWSCPEDAIQAAYALMANANLLKVSEEEAYLLCGQVPLEEAAAQLLAQGPQLVAITLAQAGALLATASHCVWVDALPVANAIDTTGAGDSFWGACLTWLLREGRVTSGEDLSHLSATDLAACGAYGCAAASITVERPGGMTSSPTMLEVADRLTQAALS